MEFGIAAIIVIIVLILVFQIILFCQLENIIMMVKETKKELDQKKDECKSLLNYETEEKKKK